jgi:DNA-binding NtrC family response regulator
VIVGSAEEWDITRFRKDLQERFAAVVINVPPLRNRGRSVIRAFAGDFLNELSRHFRSRKTLAGDALEALCRYPWPGNLIEPRNAIECAFLVARGDGD